MNIDELLCKLFLGTHLTERDLYYIYSRAIQIFIEESNVLEISSPIAVCRDICGRFDQLINLVKQGKSFQAFTFIFTGDLIQRGDKTVQIIQFLLCLKIKYRKKIFLFQGSSQSRNKVIALHFYEKLCTLYQNIKCWSLINDILKYLPERGIIDDKCHIFQGIIFCLTEEKYISNWPQYNQEQKIETTNAINFSKEQNNELFYKRKLPQNLISLSSAEGKKIFNESMQQGNCESFFTLVQQFVTQNEPTTCGTATLSMVLNSLKIDPGIKWKGIWRWYDDYNIKHLDPSLLQLGMTLQQFHELAQLNKAKSMAFSPLEGFSGQQQIFAKKSSLNFFRNAVIACCRRSNFILTINFYRQALNQTGTGHFEPLAAYNSKRDMVLLLDVAKFKYESHWCSLTTLYEAFKAIDPTSKISRGFLINSKEEVEQSQLLSSFCKFENDIKMSQQLMQQLNLIKEKKDIDKIIIILNNQSLHPLFIPLLYQNYIQETKRNGIVNHYYEQYKNNDLYSQIESKLTNEAKQLIQIFSVQPHSAIYFLLILFSKSDSINFEENNARSDLKCYKNCQLYLNIFDKS